MPAWVPSFNLNKKYVALPGTNEYTDGTVSLLCV
jgi:hypothetical protein